MTNNANTITLSRDELKTLLAEAVKAAVTEAKVANIPAIKAAKSERSMKNEVLTARAFKKAGFGDVKPHETIKTYDRWLAEGRKVKEGEKAVRVKNLRLFHVSQTEVITGEMKGKSLEEMKAAIRAYNEAKKAANNAVSA